MIDSTHVRAHLAAGDALDGVEKFAEHRLLKRQPRLAHRIELTPLDQRSLDGQERIAELYHEQLVVHLVGASLGCPSAVVASMEPDERIRYRRQLAAVKPSVWGMRSSRAGS